MLFEKGSDDMLRTYQTSWSGRYILQGLRYCDLSSYQSRSNTEGRGQASDIMTDSMRAIFREIGQKPA